MTNLLANTQNLKMLLVFTSGESFYIVRSQQGLLKSVVLRCITTWKISQKLNFWSIKQRCLMTKISQNSTVLYAGFISIKKKKKNRREGVNLDRKKGTVLIVFEEIYLHRYTGQEKGEVVLFLFMLFHLCSSIVIAEGEQEEGVCVFEEWEKVLWRGREKKLIRNK